VEFPTPSKQQQKKLGPLRKHTVINPATGEKMVIKSRVQFKWRATRRLRIVDPKTGEEVLPAPTKTIDDLLRQSGAPAVEETRMPRSSVASSRLSNGTTCSGPRRRSVTPSGRRTRQSIAGRALHDGNTWALEPASGGNWDWPLSRQEKKDRVLMLSQLELMEEIEELQAQCGHSDFD